MICILAACNFGDLDRISRATARVSELCTTSVPGGGGDQARGQPAEV
jgi:hypothetical protein